MEGDESSILGSVCSAEELSGDSSTDGSLSKTIISLNKHNESTSNNVVEFTLSLNDSMDRISIDSSRDELSLTARKRRNFWNRYLEAVENYLEDMRSMQNVCISSLSHSIEYSYL